MSLSSRDAVVLQAAEACCALFVERGTTRLTIAEICSAVGLSTRSFHRYFPTRSEVLKPVFDWTTAAFNHAVLTAPPGTLRDALLQGYAAMLGGELTGRTRGLFPLVFADPEMFSVFLRAVHEGEVTLRPIVAERTHRSPDAVPVWVTAATVAAATKIALERMVRDGDDPQTTFAELLAAVDDEDLFSH